jgi:hypothetical protein
MHRYGLAILLSAAALPQLATAETSLTVTQLRTCRSQSDTAKRLACYDALGNEECRYESDPVARLACYDALVAAVSSHR